MGYHWMIVYGELDLGSAIEELDKVMEVIKSNKFDEEDLMKVSKLAEIIKEKAEEELENKNNED